MRHDTRVRDDEQVMSRGKIFSNHEVTPELERIVRAIRAELRGLFKNNTEVRQSVIVLRRDPPY